MFSLTQDEKINHNDQNIVFTVRVQLVDPRPIRSGHYSRRQTTYRWYLYQLHRVGSTVHREEETVHIFL